MPALGTEFGSYVNRMLTVCSSVEVTREQSAVGSVARQQLTPYRLGHLYEAAYLRIFAKWEAFLEECCIRYMVGYASPFYVPVLRVTRFGTLGIARASLYGGRDYLLWHNPHAVISRVGALMASCPIETVVATSLTTLEAMAWVRHRVAHDSEDARGNFDKATMTLAGRRYQGGRPGLFLRSLDGVPHRWLQELGGRMANLALQMAP